MTTITHYFQNSTLIDSWPTYVRLYIVSFWFRSTFFIAFAVCGLTFMLPTMHLESSLSGMLA